MTVLGESALHWAVEFFYDLPHLRKDKPLAEQQEKRLPEETSDCLAKALAERVLRDFSVMLPPLPLLKDGLWHCWRHGDPACLQLWVKDQLQRHPSFFSDFMSILVTWSYGGSGRSFSWPGDEDICRFAPKFVDAEWLVTAFDPPQPAKRTSWHREITLDEAAYRLITLLKNGVVAPDGGMYNE